MLRLVALPSLVFLTTVGLFPYFKSTAGDLVLTAYRSLGPNRARFLANLRDRSFVNGELTPALAETLRRLEKRPGSLYRFSRPLITASHSSYFFRFQQRALPSRYSEDAALVFYRASEPLPETCERVESGEEVTLARCR